MCVINVKEIIAYLDNIVKLLTKTNVIIPSPNKNMIEYAVGDLYVALNHNYNLLVSKDKSFWTYLEPLNKINVDEYVHKQKNLYVEFLTIFTTLLNWFYIDYNQSNLSSAELQRKCLISCKRNYDGAYTFVILYKQGSDLHPKQHELSVDIPDLCFVEYLLGKEAAIALPYIEEPGYPVMLNFEL